MRIFLAKYADRFFANACVHARACVHAHMYMRKICILAGATGTSLVYARTSDTCKNGVMQCVAVCCSVLQCVPVFCNVLQCSAVCCSVLQCVAMSCSVLQCVAVCCSVLQCVAVSCASLYGFDRRIATS